MPYFGWYRKGEQLKTKWQHPNTQRHLTILVRSILHVEVTVTWMHLIGLFKIKLLIAS